MTTTSKYEEFLDLMMEDGNFEDVLEYFDITVYEAFDCLFENGLIDEEMINEYTRRRDE